MADVRIDSERVETSMLSPLPRGEDENGADHHSPRLLILDRAAAGAASSTSTPVLRSEIASFLEARGYQVIAYASVGEALPVLRRARPELLILAVGIRFAIELGIRPADLYTVHETTGGP